MNASATRVDRRLFQSPLAPLLVKLEIETDRARLVLAHCKRLAAKVQESANEKHRQAGRAQAAIARMAVEGLEPASYSLALAELARLRNACDTQREQQRGLEAQVWRAVQACAALHRRVDAMQVLLRRAEQQHERAVLRRQCRENDLAWLARCGVPTASGLGPWSGS